MFSKFPLVIGLSGGADSAAVAAWAAHRFGPENVIGATCVNHHVFAYEIELARRVADQLRIAWRPFTVTPPDTFLTDELPCYACKKAVFSGIAAIARAEGAEHILDGSNADDDPAERPGMKALEELSVRSPLREMGVPKMDFDGYMARLELPEWMRMGGFHDESCAGVRILSGLRTADAMRMIEQAEDALRGAVPGLRLKMRDGVIHPAKKGGRLTPEEAALVAARLDEMKLAYSMLG